MKSKTPVQTDPVAKPVRTSLRRQFFELIPGEALSFQRLATPQAGESLNDAATRVGRKMRESYSRYVTDARQQTGKKYECVTSRQWEASSFMVTYQIICRG